MIKLGKNFRLKVEDPDTPASFLTIAGEQKLAFASSPDTIDSSSKDDGAYKTELYGQQKVTLTVSGKVKLPDDGLAALDALAKTPGDSAQVKIVDTTDDTDKFVAEMSVGNRQLDFDDSQAATYSFSLSLAAAPITDALLG